MKYPYIILLVLFLIVQNKSYSQNWEVLSTKNTCTNRHENSLVSMGKDIFLVGGRGIKPVEVFNTETQTWKKAAETPIEMHHFQAIAYENEIYVLGAFTGTELFPKEKPISNIYIFNIQKDVWRKGPEIPKERLRGAAGCFVFNNKIYLVGGALEGHWDGHVAWFDEFDPNTNTWKKLEDAPHARDHFSVAMMDDKLYVAGGRRTSGKIGKYLDLTEAAVDVYDFKTGLWSTLPASLNIPTQRAGTSAVAAGNKLIIIGGESGVQAKAHNEVEALDIQKMTWEQLPALNIGRHGTSAALIEDKIYTAAGSGNSGGSPELNSIELLRLTN